MTKADDVDRLLTRQAHVDVVDVEQRKGKFRKIKAILDSHLSFDRASVLEIGCGSGVAAAEFAKLVGPEGRVAAVDVRDLRVMKDGFEFQQVDGVELPHDDESFDAVISNHVMEHVGDDATQVIHLREIRRLLRPDGIGYVSVPNRWRPIEPHLRLPIVSWLPQRGSDAYVRAFRRGPYYDVNPPSHRKMWRLLDAAGLEWRDVTYESMQVMAQVEDVKPFTRRLLGAPRWIYASVSPFISTMIYLVRRPG